MNSVPCIHELCVVLRNIFMPLPACAKLFALLASENVFSCLFSVFIFLVPGVGIEPTRPCDRQILSLLRLPISPPGRVLVHSLQWKSRKCEVKLLWRPRRESNSRIALLQRAELPLFYVATRSLYHFIAKSSNGFEPALFVFYLALDFIYTLTVFLADINCNFEEWDAHHASMVLDIFAKVT